MLSTAAKTPTLTLARSSSLRLVWGSQGTVVAMLVSYRRELSWGADDGFCGVWRWAEHTTGALVRREVAVKVGACRRGVVEPSMMLILVTDAHAVRTETCCSIEFAVKQGVLLHRC